MIPPATEQRLSHARKAISRAVAAKQLTAPTETNLVRWLEQPQYARYQQRLLEMVEAEEFEELDLLFWEVIPFGTGGRRGHLGELGSATVNTRTIAESAHGLAIYCLKHRTGTTEARPRAVVARDTRHRSEEFARLTATTLAAHGFEVFFFSEPRSTPELSYAVRQLDCLTGVMISASHNPPGDNGFKAYWSTGGQVLAPHDRGIIDEVYAAGEIPEADFDECLADGRIQLTDAQIDQTYVDAVCEQSLTDDRDLPGIFSPLHGVGASNVYRALQQLGFTGISLFGPHEPLDPDFSGVPDQLPNPERSEVFAPLIEQARTGDAALLLASDPDADRIAAMVRTPADEFVPLTGNQAGALIADHILRCRQKAGTLSKQHFVCRSIVTTPLVTAIAKHYGARAIDDLLVGFKYIAETMDDLGPEKFVFGVEESLGYLSGSYARDKDAAIGGLYLAELAALLRVEGKTLLDRLDELYLRHGFFIEGQLSKVCHGPRGAEQIRGLMELFRLAPPEQLGPVRLCQVRDYGKGQLRTLPGNATAGKLAGPEGSLMFLDSVPPDKADEAPVAFSIAVRPSGTEPKIKFYMFARGAVAGEAELGKAKAALRKQYAAVGGALSVWVDESVAEL
ncbi:MAG: phospho-sugar mutase [Planctomycetaceae bacterium]|nr:phospho-sugar mutase [Planctomycetaceae bacterium]